MKVDVSEIKTFKTCKRQWLLTSRNRMHLTPVETKSVFAMGTLFHEALHALYMGVPVAQVMDDITPRMSADHTALLAMIPGYAREVIPRDLDRYQVLDIEHRFDIVPYNSDGEIINPDISIIGSIDMIALDPAEGKIYGFEHKTAKNFRDACYLWMDEQPRVYTFALKDYIQKYNAQMGTNYELGGIYINEVKKLLRKFDYCRSLCVYPADDLDNFLEAFFATCNACKREVDEDSVGTPNPSWMTCQMCDYKFLCETYMYSTITKEQVLKEFGDYIKVREHDHLEEK